MIHTVGAAVVVFGRKNFSRICCLITAYSSGFGCSRGSDFGKVGFPKLDMDSFFEALTISEYSTIFDEYNFDPFLCTIGASVSVNVSSSITITGDWLTAPNIFGFWNKIMGAVGVAGVVGRFFIFIFWIQCDCSVGCAVFGLMVITFRTRGAEVSWWGGSSSDSSDSSSELGLDRWINVVCIGRVDGGVVEKLSRKLG